MPCISARSGLEARQGRKVIVVVTDGGDTVSQIDCPQGARSRATGRRRDLRRRGHADHQRSRAQYRRRARAANHGPGHRRADSSCPTIGPELDKAFTAIITELRTQYLLGFYPQNVPLTKDRFHKLEVRVQPPGFAGFGAQRLLWGGRGRVRGSPEDRITVSPDRQKPTAAEKEALGETTTPPPGKSARAPEQTFEEAKYLKQLIENSTRSE